MAATELSAAETEELRRDLAGLQDELGRVLATSRDAAQPVDLDQPIGRVSRIDAIAQQEMAQANRAAMVLREKQVRAALDRLEAGTYGLCVACDETVGFARLKARPETPFCIACQTRRERR